jgi:hypothetical protein
MRRKELDFEGIEEYSAVAVFGGVTFERSSIISSKS